MTANYTEAELKTQIIKQDINQTTLYYSLVKKQAKNFSIMSNDRLLVYDANRKILFYNNDFKNTPFKSTVPSPKNDVYTPLATCNFKNPNSTNEIQVRYTGKNSKQELQTIEWNFICESPQLTKNWMYLLEEEKNLLVKQATGQKGGGFIHDTLLQAMATNKNNQNSPPRQTILKPEEQLVKTEPFQQYVKESNVRESRLSDPNNSKFGTNILPQNSIISKRNNSNIQANQSRVLIQQSQTRNDPSYQINEQSRFTPQEQTSLFKLKQVSVISNKSNKSQHGSQKIDWNLKFIKNPHQSTIIQFQEESVSRFMSIWDKDLRENGVQRVYQFSDMRIYVSNLFSSVAGLLKREFRNYHFIQESCKDKIIAGVPLATLIEWQGVVALVKATLPLQAPKIHINQAIKQIRQLQLHTRVSNAVLEKASLWDLSGIYGMNNNKKMIYIDNLEEYLPLNLDLEYSNTSLRPEFLLDSVNQIIPGGEVKSINKQEWKLLTSICDGMPKNIKQLATHLSNQQTLWVDALQLKQIFHSNGVNFKYLPKVYAQITSKQVRRYVQCVMAAKVAKDQINEVISQIRKQQKTQNLPSIVEDCLKSLIQGNNSKSSQFWKEISLKFKKQFSIPINNSELIGGFFLNCLIKLLRINCDLTKLNKSKKIFKQEGVILPGFVVSMEPKVKSYYKYTTELIQKVKYFTSEQRKDEDLYDEIIKTLELQNQPLPKEYSSGQNKDLILQYLSYYTPPANLDSIPLKHIPIYADIWKEPPRNFTLRMTKTYLNWCINKDKPEEFKKGVENALKISDYWMDQTHLHNCNIYQLLSNFYASLGNGEESINFMKESLSRCIRACGAQSKLTGQKYYELGERELKVGRKKEALQNFTKAKIIMESHQDKSLNYPRLLMRHAALNLNNGDIQGCIQGSLKAIKEFEEYDKRTESKGVITEGLKIKTFEVLSRAYEISGKSNEFKSIALLCAKSFNKPKSNNNQWVFEQMLRICLASVIFKNPVEKCAIFEKLIEKLIQQQPIEANIAIKELMHVADDMVVMQKFINRFENIQRLVREQKRTNSESKESKENRDFLLITRLLICSIGQDYVRGLIHQKKYQ